MESIDINTAISTQSERIITRNKCVDNTKRYKSKKKTQYRVEHFGLANTDLLPTKKSLIVRIHNIAY